MRGAEDEAEEGEVDEEVLKRERACLLDDGRIATSREAAERSLVALEELC